jgi:Lrp/AsnC family transcriptional regulator for asnA, asnC and gidA
MIDKLDQNIILQLRKNARLSNVALAKLLNASERTIRNRIAHLTEKGIISTTVIPNLEMLGFNFMGIMGLQIRRADLKQVTAKLVQQPSVCYLVNVTGQYDLIAIVLTRSAKDFSDFVETQISSIPSVIRTETFVCLNIYKGHEGGPDIGQIIDNIEVVNSKKA